METKIFFCDTYAVLEIINGNKNYQAYTDNILITSDFNLMELYYALLRDHGKDSADKYFDVWAEFSIHVPTSVIKAAMEIKLANRKENLSYVDCIGYAFSLSNGILFLTGDIKFKDKPGVEFVK